jgi:hypothetical protein
VGFDSRSFFPWDGRPSRPHAATLSRVSRPQRKKVGGGDWVRRWRRLTGKRRQRKDSEPGERGDIVRKRPNGEWRCSTRRHMLGPERSEAVSLDRALYLPTFSHLLSKFCFCKNNKRIIIIVNKVLPLSLSLFVSHLLLMNDRGQRKTLNPN